MDINHQRFQKVTNQTISFYFYLFLFIHIFLWTVAAYFARCNLPMDAIEGTVWGHQFEWGYDKNPLMNALVTSFATSIGSYLSKLLNSLSPEKYSEFFIYLAGQISIGVGFWATWKLAQKIASPIIALIAILSLECIQYFNLHAIDFNDNTLEVGLWALTILFFYKAILRNHLKDWLLTGMFAGFCLLTKYYCVMLFIPMTAFLLKEPSCEIKFKSFNLYLALILFMLIISPHIYWLLNNDFISLQYALNRVSVKPAIGNHFYFPLKFSWEQLVVFSPAFLFIFLMCRFTHTNSEEPTASFNKRFLLFMGIGPFLLTVLLSLIFGLKLRAGWGQPLLSLWPLILLVYLQPKFTFQQTQKYFAAILGLLLFFIFIYGFAMYKAKDTSSAIYPGQQIADAITNEWQQTFKQPLRFVAGPRWVAGNIAFYSKNKPSVYIQWDKKLSPWINEEALKKYGAVFVWEMGETDNVDFNQILSRYKNISHFKTLYFKWSRNKNFSPVVIKIAFLAPSLQPALS